MPKTIEAVYEGGVFKPLKKIRLNERQIVELNVFTQAEIDDANKAAFSIIGIGKSTFKDSAQKHDEYLYSRKRRITKQKR